MKTHSLPALFAALLAALVLSGCAATTQQQAEEPFTDQPVRKTVSRATTSPVSSQNILPKLSIRWECKKACTPNEKVAPLIEQSYAEEAANNGFAISDTDSAEVTIVDYRQRHPAVRTTVGFFAGRDRLGLRIVYRNQSRTASDTSANSLFGMNSLCESVGKKSYTALAAIVESNQNR